MGSEAEKFIAPHLGIRADNPPLAGKTRRDIRMGGGAFAGYRPVRVKVSIPTSA